MSSHYKSDPLPITGGWYFMMVLTFWQLDTVSGLPQEIVFLYVSILDTSAKMCSLFHKSVTVEFCVCKQTLFQITPMQR